MRDRLSSRAAAARPGVLVRQALALRSHEARALLRGAAEPVSGGAAETTPEQEEALRVLMVVHHPRARAGALAAPAWEAAQQLFDAITGPATRDLRFLDAWNNFYEALGSSVKNEQSFLARYVGVLDGYLHGSER